MWDKGVSVMVEGQVGKMCFFRLLGGEDLAAGIKRRVEECGVKTGVFFVIGTLKNAVLGYYEEGEYKLFGWIFLWK